MTKRKIDSTEHLNIIEVSKDDTVKRYEISAEQGYAFYIDGEKNVKSSVVFFPAKLGLENILAQISVEPYENK